MEYKKQYPTDLERDISQCLKFKSDFSIIFCESIIHLIVIRDNKRNCFRFEKDTQKLIRK